MSFLDAIAGSTTATALKTSTGAVQIGDSAPPNPGAVLVAVASDHAIWVDAGLGITLSDVTPAPVSVASGTPGTGPQAARGDHAHLVATAAPVPVVIGASAGIGSSSSLARADHVHAHPSGSPVALAVGGAASDGVAITVARSDHAHAMPGLATPTVSGFLGAADKTKLDTVATGAAGLAGLTDIPTNIRADLAQAPGIGTTAARSDHQHSISVGTPTNLTPGGSNAAGTSFAVALADHTHALPAFGSTSGTFAQGSDARLSDDRTASGLRDTTGVVDVSAAVAPVAGQYLVAISPTAAAWQSLNLAASPPPQVAIAGATGAATTIARSDHTHAHGAQTDGTLHAVATGAVAGFLSATDKTKLDGVATGAAAPSNAIPQAAIASPGSAGVAADVARSDHAHQVNAGTPVALAVGGSNAAGSATSLARSDHTHALPAFGSTSGTFAQGSDARLSDDRTASGLRTATTIVAIATAAAPSSGQALVATGTAAAAWTTILSSTTPAPIAAAGTVGVATPLARADHVHAHGSQTDGTLHATATGAVAGFLSTTDKTKLDGIATGAAALASTLPAIVDTAAGDAGTGITGSRIDHRHQVSVGSPVALTVGGAGAAGSASTLVRSDHTHAMPGLVTPSVDGFSSAADKTKLNTIATGADVTLTALAAAATPIAVNAQRITGVGDPTAAQDAVTRAYLDLTVQTSDIKQSVRLVATSNVGLSGLAAVSGVTPAAGDRVGCVGQSVAANNGIYVAAAGAWSRATDADTSAKVTTGLMFYVSEGAAGEIATTWQLTTPQPITLGTTALTFQRIAGVADKIRLDAMADGAAAVGGSTPVSLDTTAGAVGAAVTASRSDHRHAVLVATPASLTMGAASSAGASTSLVRADHIHALPAAGTPVALTLAGANAAGSAATLALSDHTHALPATAAPVALTVGGASAAGVAVTIPRSDHAHAMPALVTTAVDGFMSAADKTRLDGMATGAAALASTAPVAVGVANTVGVGTTAARADHAHDHGAQTAGGLHAVASQTVAGFMSATDKTALDKLTTGAVVEISARLATATTLPAYTATTITTNQPRLTANANGALSIDGVAIALGNLVLVLFEAAANCGLYEAMAPGSVGTPWQLDLRLSGAYLGAYANLLNGATFIVRTGPAGVAYCNREFRPVAGASGLFAENPGAPQIWPRDTVAPTTIYPGWIYNVSSLVTGANASLTLVSPPSSEQVLRGVVFGLDTETDNGFTVTITPTSPSHIQPPYSAGGVWPTSATFKLTTNSSVQWVCGRGNSSYNPDSPYWKPVADTGLAAPALAIDAGTSVRIQGSAPAAGSALIATGAATAAFSAPGLPASLSIGSAQFAGSANTHPRSDHVHAMPALASTSVDGFMAASDRLLLSRAPAIDQDVRKGFRSVLPADIYSPFTIVKDNIHWIYIGQVLSPQIVKSISTYMIAAGSGAQSAQACVASSPLQPNGTGQTLTVLFVFDTLDLFNTGPNSRKGTTNPSQSSSIAAGTFLWVGLRVSLATTQPTTLAVRGDNQMGLTLQTSGVSSAITTTTYAGSVPSPADWQAPDLCCLLA